MILDLLTENQVLNEAYYGKNPLLLDCDKRFDKIKSILETQSNKSLTNAEIESELRAIEKNLKELFNFKGITIDFKATGAVNAYTIPAVYGLDAMFDDAMSKNQKTQGKHGIQFKDGNKKYVFISLFAELFTLADLTGAEVTGVVLHEIGHNFFFDDSMMSISYRFYIFADLWMRLVMYLSNPSVDVKKKIDAVLNTVDITVPYYTKLRVIVGDFIKNDPVASKINMFTTNVNSTITSVMVAVYGVINKLLSFLYLPVHQIMHAIIGLISSVNVLSPGNMVGYRNEKFSDNFATAYGYGQEVISTQIKFETNSMTYADKMTNGSILALTSDMSNTLYKMLGYLGDPHPDTITRCKEQLNYLKHNLSKVDNPQARKLLLEDIKQCEKKINEMDDVIQNANKVNSKIFSGMFYSSMANMGGDAREKLPFYKNSNYDYKQFDTK